MAATTNYHQSLFIVIIIVMIIINYHFTAAANRPIIIPRKFSLISNYFGYQLLNQLNNEQSNDDVKKNLLISPFSLTITLTMLHLTTDPDSLSRQQIETLLEFNMANIDGDDSDRIRDYIKKLLLKLNDLKNTRTLIANETLKINLDYIQMLSDYFNGEIILNQFINNDNDNDNNNDIDDNDSDISNDNISTDFILNGSTVIENSLPINNDDNRNEMNANSLLILDAAYFNGLWLHQFDILHTRPSTFYGSNYVTYENVPFMRLKAAVAIVPLDEIDAAMIELPFKDQRYSLYIILPSRINDDLTLIRRAINPWYIETSIRQMNIYGKILIELPTFGIDAEYDLRETFERMGLRNIFNQKRSNITNQISLNNSNDNIFISDIKHKIRMKFDENGIGPNIESRMQLKQRQKNRLKMMKQKQYDQSKNAALSFDHPFLYFLRHQRTGTILLMGEMHGF